MKPKSKSPNNSNATRLGQSKIFGKGSQSVSRLKKHDESSLNLHFNNSLDITKNTINESTVNAYLSHPGKDRKILPSNYQTESFNVNKDVETLISILEPTPEQKEKQDALLQLQLAE